MAGPNANGTGLGKTWIAIVIMLPLMGAMMGGGLWLGSLNERTHSVQNDLADLRAMMEATAGKTSAILERVMAIEANQKSSTKSPAP